MPTWKSYAVALLLGTTSAWSGAQTVTGSVTYDPAEASFKIVDTSSFFFNSSGSAEVFVFDRGSGSVMVSTGGQQAVKFDAAIEFFVASVQHSGQVVGVKLFLFDSLGKVVSRTILPTPDFAYPYGLTFAQSLLPSTGFASTQYTFNIAREGTPGFSIPLDELYDGHVDEATWINGLHFQSATGNLAVTSVPEPPTALLMALGLASVSALRLPGSRFRWKADCRAAV